jgi:hypothetical protein
MTDSDFECPTGAAVPYDLTRCPRCNWNMYPGDDAPEPGFQPTSPDETRLLPASLAAWLGGVLAGWVAAGGLAFFVHLLVGRLVTPAALTTGWQVLLYAANVLAAAVGGALAAMLAQADGEGRRPKPLTQQALLAGGVVGLLAAFNAVLLETHWQRVSLGLLADPYFLVMLLLTLSAGPDGALFYRLLARRPSGLAAPLKSEAMLFDDLLRRVGYDRGVAERLIELVQRKTPNASRFLLIINAIERLEHDRR